MALKIVLLLIAALVALTFAVPHPQQPYFNTYYRPGSYGNSGYYGNNNYYGMMNNRPYGTAGYYGGGYNGNAGQYGANYYPSYYSGTFGK